MAPQTIGVKPLKALPGTYTERAPTWHVDILPCVSSSSCSAPSTSNQLFRETIVLYDRLNFPPYFSAGEFLTYRPPEANTFVSRYLWLQLLVD